MADTDTQFFGPALFGLFLCILVKCIGQSSYLLFEAGTDTQKR